MTSTPTDHTLAPDDVVIPSTTAVAGHRAARLPGPPFVRAARMIVRVIGALVLLAAAVSALLVEEQLRLAEAGAFAWVLSHTVSDSVHTGALGGSPVISFSTASGWHSLRLTAVCSITYYLAPALALGAILTLTPSVRPLRAWAASLVAVVGLVALNQARLLMLALALARFGLDGFHWAHGPIGTAVMLLGIGGTLLMFFVVCLSPARAATRSRR